MKLFIRTRPGHHVIDTIIQREINKGIKGLLLPHCQQFFNIVIQLCCFVTINKICSGLTFEHIIGNCCYCSVVTNDSSKGSFDQNFLSLLCESAFLSIMSKEKPVTIFTPLELVSYNLINYDYLYFGCLKELTFHLHNDFATQCTIMRFLSQ